MNRTRGPMRDAEAGDRKARAETGTRDRETDSTTNAGARGTSPGRAATPGRYERTDGDRACYVYCLVRSSDRPALEDAPRGLPDLGGLRLLSLRDDLWLVAADAPLPTYSADEVETQLADVAWVSQRAVAHERVVEHFLDVGTVVPFKLLTLFSSDERAVDGVLSREASLEVVLQRIEDCREWGVQVRLDRRAAAAGVAGSAASGTEYLARKQQARESAGSVPTAVRDALDDAFESLTGVAEAARRHELPAPSGNTPLLLDAAFLVADDGTSSFESAVNDAARRLAEHHCELALTGPWPPYNFVTDETDTDAEETCADADRADADADRTETDAGRTDTDRADTDAGRTGATAETGDGTGA